MALACPFHVELGGKEKGGFGLLGIKGQRKSGLR
jgi:hypothetical protein